jgi:hypothetical protein
MATKEDLHELKITTYAVPLAGTPATVLSTTAAAIDTKNYESTMFILTIGAAGVTDAVFQLQDTDTTSTTAGTAVTGRNVIFAAEDDDTLWLGTTSAVGLFVQSTGTLTCSTNPVNHTFIFAYTGAKRWVRLVATAGSSLTYSVVVVQGHARYLGRQGLHSPVYLGTA